MTKKKGVVHDDAVDNPQKLFECKDQGEKIQKIQAFEVSRSNYCGKDPDAEPQPARA